LSSKKAREAIQLILERIVHADHAADGIPSERQLADSMGISRTTVRQATRHLLDKGVLVRRDNGRLAVAQRGPASPRRGRTIGFLCPAGLSLDGEMWRQGVQAALEGYSVTLRFISYAHWGDPALSDALRACDGLFLLRSIEPIPELVLSMMRQSSCRVVVLDQDETAAGLPSVVLFPPAENVRLLDHLVRLGHRRIDCINTQSSDAVIQGRIAAWSDYVERRGLSGQLRSQPIFSPIEGAYRLVREILRQGRPLGTALFCTTGPAAIGAMRALHEANLDIGRDVSVCAVNDEGLGRYLLKSLTALESPPRALYLRRGVEWMFDEGPWEGPLLVQPTTVNLFEGESTGPAPAVTAIVAPAQ
jgi:DNA-binding LacI/PurR family transcriptional regulator/biotin operon repressor